MLHTFSIIDFTGTEANGSVGHGLGVEPSMFIMKRYTDDGYSSTAAWYIYNKSLGANKYLEFDRESSLGMRLDIPSGTAVRFEPGQTREVDLIKYSGKRKVYGFNGKINGQLEKE